VTEQLPELRLQVVLLNPPFVFGATVQVTVPVGVLPLPVSLSATVAWQLVPTPTWTELGVHDTVTLTVRLLTVRLNALPLLVLPLWTLSFGV
jgi:hypothetical protein